MVDGGSECADFWDLCLIMLGMKDRPYLELLQGFILNWKAMAVPAWDVTFGFKFRSNIYEIRTHTELYALRRHDTD